MFNNKKILMIGPPGVGKTTFKKVFFDMANPLTLLNEPLEPSRGMTTNVYSVLDFNLGVFDLAGQENDNWFDKDDIIFNQSDLIIVILDINSYLKEILNFIEKVIEVYMKFNLSNCKFILLLHKVDLIDALYLQHKIKAVKEYTNQYVKSGIKLEIITTSIAKEFFFDTYDKITKIILDLFENKLDFIKQTIDQDLRIDLKIIVEYEIEKAYQAIDLVHDLKIPKSEIDSHLKRLEKLGFIEFLENYQNFQLTNRASFFKIGLEKLDEKQNKINKVLESFFLFSNLYSEDKQVL